MTTDLVSLLRHRAATQPDALAYAFVRQGEIIEKSLTYRELDLKARAMAAHLQTFSQVGDRAIVVIPTTRALI
ncbi:MAG: fatty acyl-AMP ligase, partial [Synechococcaceae cyanobacterium RL_1_2]|nr:fatty acyl-AMP ligase [Synechococcaceae cyanobacterium RL_1_2]